jgi:predicted exporter
LKKPSLFYIWIIYLVVIAGGGLFIGLKGFQINTDFLSIFPKHTERGGFYKANALYESVFENELLVIVKGPDREKAILAADNLAQEIAKEDIFASVKLKISGAESGNKNPNQWVPYLYGKRKALLTRDQIALIKGQQTQVILEKALNNIYSPVGVTSQLSTDPLNLFQDYFLGTSANFLLKPYNGYLIADKDDASAVFMRIQLNTKASSFNERLIDFYEKTKAATLNKDIGVYFFGASLFSAFGSQKSMDEVNTYGTLSFLAVLMLLVWCFSSVVPVIASLFTIVISVASGLVAVMLVYSSVHILSILLGISILGIVTDYCTHFFAKGFDENLHSSEEVMKKIKGALGMGFLTNVLTYICFYFTDLVVLKQLSIFTIAGIFTTYLTVMALFPRFRFRKLKVGKLGKVSALSSVWDHFGIWKSIAAISVIVVAGFVVLKGLHFNDDVKLLQNVPTVLKNDETAVFDFIGAKNSSSYFLVKGKTPDDVLVQEEKLTEQLHAKSFKSVAFSNYVPSLQKQQESLQLYAGLEAVVRDFYKTLKIQDPQKVKNLFQDQPPVFTAKDLLTTSSDFPVAMNWLGKVDDSYYSVVNVVGTADYQDLKQMENDSAQLMSKAIDLTHVLELLRKTITGQFSLVILSLSVLLVVVWGRKRAFFILFPPVISAAATLVAMQAYAGYLNLFNVLAVILIFCLGMDYSVFFSQSKNSTEATHVGILISFLSTIGSFGVLGMSSTYAVSSFGISVFIGITLCYLLAPLAAGGDDA